MTTATRADRTVFSFAAEGHTFTIVRNADDNYSILDAFLNAFTSFSYGGDPEDSFELEAAAVASVQFEIRSL